MNTRQSNSIQTNENDRQYGHIYSWFITKNDYYLDHYDLLPKEYATAPMKYVCQSLTNVAADNIKPYFPLH
jgi:hypothetical protein